MLPLLAAVVGLLALEVWGCGGQLRGRGATSSASRTKSSSQAEVLATRAAKYRDALALHRARRRRQLKIPTRSASGRPARRRY
jgi:hypothetical protein